MQQNPYVGPRPYERGDRLTFFGRRREARELRALIVAEREVLCYAQSGAGKTSLFNAQVIPALEEEGFHVLPVARVGVPPPAGVAETPGINVFVSSALLSLAGEASSPVALSGQTLMAYLSTVAAADSRPPILIFDQFEELFTTQRERWQDADGFFAQARAALDALPQLGLVFVMREDHVAELDPYLGWFPHRLRARFRLEPLGPEGALEAVAKPAAQAGCAFAPGVAERLVDDLRRLKVQRDLAATAETAVLGPFVEPVQLQVVCRQLWDNLPDQADRTIQWEDVARYGDIDRALTAFYENAVAEATQVGSVDELTVRRWFNTQLITPLGTRGLALRGPEATAGLPNAAVDILEHRHLIRADLRAGARWYELSHDRLVDPILESNRAWEAARETPLRTAARHWQETQAAALLYRDAVLAEAEAWAAAHPADVEPYEAEFLQASRQAEQDRRQRQRWLRAGAIAAAVVLVIMAILTVAAIRGQNQAQTALVQAEQAQATAELRQQQAEAAQSEAELQRQEAEEQRQEAERQRQAAEVARAEAEQLRQIAVARQLAALAALLPDRSAHGVTPGALLAIESVRYRPTAEGNQALRQALARLPYPAIQLTVTAAVERLVFSPDGRWLLVAGESGQAALVDGNWMPALTFTYTGPTWKGAFSPDGLWLAVPGPAGVTVWDLGSTRQTSLTLELGETPTAVQFSPDGTWLAARGTTQARLWQTGTWRPRARGVLPASAGGLVFSPGGRYVAFLTGRSAQVWEVASGRALYTISPYGGLPPGETVSFEMIDHLAFSPDERWLAFAWSEGLGGNPYAAGSEVWDAETGQPVAELWREGRANELQFSPDGRWLVLGGTMGPAAVFSVGGWSEVTRLGSHGTYWLDFLPDGHRLVAFWQWMVESPGPATLGVWESGGWQPVAHFNLESMVQWSPDWRLPDWSQVVSADGRWLALNTTCIATDLYQEAACNGAVRVWDARQWRESAQLVRPDWLGDPALSPDGRWLATGQGTTVWIWNLAEPPPLVDPAPALAEGHQVWLQSEEPLDETWARFTLAPEAISPDGHWEVTAAGGALTLREPAVGAAQVLTAAGDALVAFAPTGEQVAAVTDRTVTVWDVATGRPRGQIQHFWPVGTLAFSPDGRWVVSASSLDLVFWAGVSRVEVRVWEAATGLELFRTDYEGELSEVAFSADARWIAVTDTGGNVQLWRWQPDDLAAELCGRLGRNLTTEEWRQYIGAEAYRQTCPQLLATP